MEKNNVVISGDEIPHGHGLSFKKGLADGLLESNHYENEFHNTHAHSYARGKVVGDELRERIAKLVKK